MDDYDAQVDSTPMIDPDTGIEIENDTLQVDPEEMKEFLYTCHQVFLDDIPEDFDIDLDEKTDEISQLLEANPDTLEATFQELADRVEYKGFWTKYFYRLHDERLEDTYCDYYNANQEQQSTTPTGPGTLSRVTGFLGGAVKRLVDETDDDGYEEEAAVAPSPFHNFTSSTAQPSASSAMAFLTGGGGRPPFVLNTAVSEDEDGGEEDEDEEEELGWDDDDDDEDEDDQLDEQSEEGEDLNTSTSTIEFNDAEKEELQDKLEQAMAERDALANTVQMQNEELAKFKSLTPEDDDSGQVEALKMQLFEKDSELAALRANVEDSRLNEEDDEVEKRKQEAAAFKLQQALIETQEQELEACQKQLKESRNALEEEMALRKQLERALAEEKAHGQQEVDRLMSELESARQVIQDSACSASSSDAATQQLTVELHSERELRKQDAHEAERALAEEQAHRQEEVESLTTELESVRQTVQDSASSDDAAAQNLQAQLESEKELREQEAENAEKALEEEKAQSKQQIDKLTAELESAKQASDTTAAQNLETESQSLKEAMSQLQTENANLRQQQEVSASTEAAKLSESETNCKTLEEGLKSAKELLGTFKEQMEALDAEYTSTKAALDQAQAELAARPSSPGSSSTGVQVTTSAEPTVAEAPPPPTSTVSKLSAGEDEDDAWDEDW